MSWIQTPTWSRKCSVGFMSGLCAGQSITSTSCCPRKSSGVMCYVGRGIVLDIHKVSSQNSHHPGKHTIADSTPYHDWGAMVTIHWFNACIYRFLPLLAVHTNMTITVKHSEARPIMEDTVPPKAEVPPSDRSSQHMAASSVVQSQSGMPRPIAGSQNPLPCSKLTTPSEIGGPPCAE